MGMPTTSIAFGFVNTFVSASTAAFLTTPIDVVKTRLQVSGANPELFSYNGPLDCVRKIVRAEGFSALFAGASGRVLCTPARTNSAPLQSQVRLLRRAVTTFVVLPFAFCRLTDLGPAMSLFFPIYDTLKRFAA